MNGHSEFANAMYFDQIRVEQQFRYDGELFVKTCERSAWSIRDGKRFKEWAFNTDDVCTLIPKLYVDDLRRCPEGWDVARSFHDAIAMLETTEYDEVSLDHDLASFYGMKEMTGRDILNWLIDRKMREVGYVPGIVHVHSANAVAVPTMLEDIAKHWPK